MILKVNNLTIPSILNGISFEINSNETLGLLGESGSGKTMTALSIMGLVNSTGGIEFDSINIRESGFNTIRGSRISMAFQESMNALNPLQKVGNQIQNVLNRHAKTITLEHLLNYVGLTTEHMSHYPHQLSGGQRQRVMLAMALGCEPDLLIADEPSTALDPQTQSDIVDMLKKRSEHGSMLLITHDLDFAKNLCDRIAVMKDGLIVEIGTTNTILNNPTHPYTQMLVDKHRLNIKPSPPTTNLIKPILKINDLSVGYKKNKWWGFDVIPCLDSISFTLMNSKTVGIIGRSGSGKTTLSQTIMNLLGNQAVYHGSIELLSNNASIPMDVLNPKNKRELRQKIQIVFQDPSSAFNPRLTIQNSFEEVLKIHSPTLDHNGRMNAINSILNDVKLDPTMQYRYPHEFSGGQRQRLVIARALLVNPQLLILDEPTASLDRVIREDILLLLKTLQMEKGISYILISHEMDVINALSHDVYELNNGSLHTVELH